MRFCPKCKALMMLSRETNEMVCKRPKCGHKEPNNKEAEITTKERIEREIVVTEGIEGTLPTTKIICEKCKHNEAT